jgi:hypothetical protein
MEADMKLLALVLPAAIAAACAMQEPVERAGPDESAIAEAVRGRTAGQPVACVTQFGLRNTRTVAGALLFEGPGDVVHVNRGAGGCRALAFGRAIRTSNPSGRLCSGDIVTAFEPVSGVEYGGCSLGEFVPYRRTD